MARKLADQENVTPPDSDYPYARIKDDQGDGNGTPVDESVYGDIHQFFARLLFKAGRVANGLPDNAYSGFQLFQALEDRINQLIANFPNGSWVSVTMLNGYVSATGFQYRKDKTGRVWLRGALDASGASGSTFGTLPAGFRPSVVYLSIATGAAGTISPFQIATNGDMSLTSHGTDTYRGEPNSFSTD